MIMFLGGSWIVRHGCATLCVLGALCFFVSASAADANGVSDAPTRAAALRAEIARHDELYFKKAAPEISDEAYDRLKRELADLEQANGKDLLNEQAGDDRSAGFSTVNHGVRMLSLQKVYTDAELAAFVKRVGAATTGKPHWVIEPKYDGVAISAVYERGRLVRVVTRGNGLEGDDVTDNARVMARLPDMLQGSGWPERIEVRGEIYASFVEFAQVNAERAQNGAGTFVNPRALAAGSLKLRDSKETVSRGLSAVFYGWGEVIPASARPVSQRAFHEQLKVWGLPGVSVRVAETEAELRRHVRALARERTDLPFPTDGVVIKLDDVSQQDALGSTDHAPRWAAAFKFSTERVSTRVKAITLQVGRSGVLTPVAELDPVQLGGSTITRASLHNAEVIAKRDVRVGDLVFIEKAGEIIPAVVEVDRSQRNPDSAPFVFPQGCPTCGAALVTRTAETGVVYCPSRDCVAQVTARLRHFASPQAVAIAGLGDSTIEALVTTRNLRSPAELYQLTRGDWMGLPGVGAKTADKLLLAVETSKRAELWRFIYGLGIPRVGAATARVLAQRFPSLEALAASRADELKTIAGVGAAQAEAIERFFAEPETRALIDAFRRAGVVPQPGNRAR
jgi:DNA ligase (NAD+)